MYKRRSKLHPLGFAANMHMQFIKLHPFQGAHKRTARIFMNAILMAYGYKPVSFRYTTPEKYKAAIFASLKDVNNESFVKFLVDTIKLERKKRAEDLEDGASTSTSTSVLPELETTK